MPGTGLTPQQAVELAKTIADIYAEATAELVRQIGHAASTASATSLRGKLAELVRLRANARRVATRAQKAAGPKAVDIVTRAYAHGLGTAPSRVLVGVHRTAVEQYAKELTGVLDPLGPRMLSWTDDVYRQVVADVTGKVLTGAVTRQQAAAEAIDRWAARGIDAYRAADGSVWRIDTYAEMATRTAAIRAHLEGKLTTIAASGNDLVIVSDHAAECPACRPWEGVVLSISGNSPSYEALSTATASGLFHPNCTHTLDLWLPGTRPRQVTADPAGYAAKQRQRALERAVRESRRRVAAAQGTGDKAAIAYQKALLRTRTDRLFAHVREHGLKESVSRQRIGPVR